jgi:hypothetical protein
MVSTHIMSLPHGNFLEYPYKTETNIIRITNVGPPVDREVGEHNYNNSYLW